MNLLINVTVRSYELTCLDRKHDGTLFLLLGAALSLVVEGVRRIMDLGDAKSRTPPIFERRPAIRVTRAGRRETGAKLRSRNHVEMVPAP